MKRIVKWVQEEKIAIIVFLLAIGTILNSPPTDFMLSGMLMYGAILILAFHLGHRLFLRLKK